MDSARAPQSARGSSPRPRARKDSRPGGPALSAKTVLVIGVFELFHRGHVEFLRRARRLGDRSIVVSMATSSSRDTSARQFSPKMIALRLLNPKKRPPCLHQQFTRRPPAIEEHGINLIVHGDDWEHASYLKQICVDQDYLDSKSIEMKYVPLRCWRQHFRDHRTHKRKRPMIAISQGERRRLQMAQLRIAAEVADLCDLHEIKYALLAGSALGARRHQGFIPWDDDMDIGLVRDEYERSRP